MAGRRMKEIKFLLDLFPTQPFGVIGGFHRLSSPITHGSDSQPMLVAPGWFMNPGVFQPVTPEAFPSGISLIAVGGLDKFRLTLMNTNATKRKLHIMLTPAVHSHDKPRPNKSGRSCFPSKISTTSNSSQPWRTASQTLLAQPLV